MGPFGAPQAHQEGQCPGGITGLHPGLPSRCLFRRGDPGRKPGRDRRVSGPGVGIHDATVLWKG
eukprot:8119362-Lingulodinium_polyedra.AAC.1